MESGSQLNNQINWMTLRNPDYFVRFFVNCPVFKWSFPIRNPDFFCRISNGIRIPDHSSTGHIFTIRKPDLSGFRMVTVFKLLKNTMFFYLNGKSMWLSIKPVCLVTWPFKNRSDTQVIVQNPDILVSIIQIVPLNQTGTSWTYFCYLNTRLV